jgi:hypothetical protein
MPRYQLLQHQGQQAQPMKQEANLLPRQFLDTTCSKHPSEPTYRLIVSCSHSDTPFVFSFGILDIIISL